MTQINGDLRSRSSLLATPSTKTIVADMAENSVSPLSSRSPVAPVTNVSSFLPTLQMVLIASTPLYAPSFSVTPIVPFRVCLIFVESLHTQCNIDGSLTGELFVARKICYQWADLNAVEGVVYF